MKNWRFTARLALRWARRNLRLTVAMVAGLAVPLAAAIAVSTLRSNAEFTAEEQIAGRRGQSETVLRNPGLVSDHGVRQALSLAPEALATATGQRIRAFPEVTGSSSASTAARSVGLMVYGLDLDEPVHRGRFDLREGRTARSAREVALSAGAAKRLRLRPGETVKLGESGQPATVTGILVDAADTDRMFVVTTPEQAARVVPTPPTPATRVPLVASTDPTAIAWHVPQHLQAQRNLLAAGWQVETREQALAMVAPASSVFDAPSLPWTLLLSAFALAQSGLVLGARYALVLRRGRRRPAVRRIIVCHSALAGVSAATAGVTLGLLAAILLTPAIAENHHQVWQTLRIDPMAVVAVVLLGLTTPAVAAGIATRTARRSKSKLSGAAMPLTAGLLMIIGGAATFAPYLVAMGALVLVIGTGPLLRAALTALGTRREPQLDRSPNLVAASAVVLASLTAFGGLVLTGLAGLAENVERSYVPAGPAGSILVRLTELPRRSTITAATEVLGSERFVEMRLASPPAPLTSQGVPYNAWGPYQAADPSQNDDPAAASSVAVIETADIDRVLGRAATPKEREALDAGSAVVMDTRLAPNGMVTVRAPGSTAGLLNQADGTVDAELPAVVARSRWPYHQLPAVYVTDAGLAALNGTAQTHEALLYAPAAEVASSQEARARAILAADIGSEAFRLDVETGPPGGTLLRNTTIAVILLMTTVAATLSYAISTTGHSLRSVGSFRAAASVGVQALLGISIGLITTAGITPVLLESLQSRWTVTPWPGLLAMAVCTVAATILTAKLSLRRPAHSPRG